MDKGARPAAVAALLRGAAAALGGLTESEGVASALARLLAAGQEAHPALAVPPERFGAHVGALLVPAEDAPTVATRIAGLRAADLYLACACCAGVTGAIDVFEREHLAQLPMQLGKARLAPDLVDEVRQQLLIKLLVASDGGRPRMEEYQGRGALGGWVAVIAMRLALDLQRGRPVIDQRVDDGARPEGIGDGVDPELAYLRRRYGAEFRHALAGALVALPEEQREALRLNLVEGFNIEAIGARRQVHRATVARWIAAARAQVVEETRRRLKEQLQVGASELSSLLRLLDSQFEVSLASLFPRVD